MVFVEFNGPPFVITYISAKTFIAEIVLIVETNSCVRQPKMQNGRFISNKKDPYKRHGFGIKSIQKVVEKYMGSYVNKYDESKQEFIVSIMLMDK